MHKLTFKEIHRFFGLHVLRIKLNFPSVGTHLTILKLVNFPPPGIITNVL